MIKPVFKLMFRATLVDDEDSYVKNVLLTDSDGYIKSKREYDRLTDEVNRCTNINLYNSRFVDRPGVYSSPEYWDDRGYPGTNHFRILCYEYDEEEIYDIDLVYVIEIDGRYFELPEIFDIENK